MRREVSLSGVMCATWTLHDCIDCAYTALAHSALCSQVYRCALYRDLLYSTKLYSCTVYSTPLHVHRTCSLMIHEHCRLRFEGTCLLGGRNPACTK